MMGMPGVTNTSQFRLLISSNSSSFWETRSEQWRFALRLFLGGLVLEHIPVFLKPVFDSHNIGGLRYEVFVLFGHRLHESFRLCTLLNRSQITRFSVDLNYLASSAPAATMGSLVFAWLSLDDRAQYLGPPDFEVHLPVQSGIQQTLES